jgi:hypothetical protein
MNEKRKTRRRGVNRKRGNKAHFLDEHIWVLTLTPILLGLLQNMDINLFIYNIAAMKKRRE